jgi:glutamine synthetase
MSYIQAEYIWLDGHKPTVMLRSKTKILNKKKISSLDDLPEWGFDGSSTEQAEGKSSDCPLRPVKFIPDPIRGEPHVLVLCEVLNAKGEVHPSNTRAHLRAVAEKYKHEEPWFGIEQEYTMYSENKPLAWTELGAEPGPQGPYYCGVGAERIFGRDLVEDHTAACLEAGLHLSGTNAEVMPGQWEFQVGTLGALEVADELWLARWLLQRLGEDHGIAISLSPKPLTEGDWNGAGGHTNFSTKAMREPGGREVINAACEKLKAKHAEHIAVYGDGNEKRLTGKHETCSINEFRYGESDRGASIRIPIFTVQHGYGYLEDRRPAANLDPYQVCAKLIETTCG